MGCMTCYSSYVFINQTSFFKSQPCWVSRKYNVNHYWDSPICPQRLSQCPRVLTTQNIREGNQLQTHTPVQAHSVLWSQVVALFPSQTWIWWLDETGKTDASSMQLFSTCLPSCWGDYKSLGFCYSICGIPQWPLCHSQPWESFPSLLLGQSYLL